MRNKERRVEKLEEELPSEDDQSEEEQTWLDVPPELVDAVERAYQLEKECGLWDGDPREAALEEVETEVRLHPEDFHLPEPDHHYNLGEEERQFWERIFREARGCDDESPGEGLTRVGIHGGGFGPSRLDINVRPGGTVGSGA